MAAVRAYEVRDRTGIDPEFVQCGSFELLLDDQQYRMAASEVKAGSAHATAWGRPPRRIPIQCSGYPWREPRSAGSCVTVWLSSLRRGW